MTSHTPYKNILKIRNIDKFNNINNKTIRNYFNSINYCDEAVGKFIEKIKILKPNAYIIISGDHMSGIKGTEYDNASFVKNNDYFEFVPFIIITPDGINYKETDEIVSFLDYAQTILSISGIKYDIKSYGSDLMKTDIQKTDTVVFKKEIYKRIDLWKLIYAERIAD